MCKKKTMKKNKQRIFEEISFQLFFLNFNFKFQISKLSYSFSQFF